MITSRLGEPGGAEQDPLSEETERKILQMVEDQLDRPNPPDTKVLYRRAMHFIDRDVRHLSLQQFNAKFPLQVKRRRAREEPTRGPGEGGRHAADGAGSGSGPRSGDGEGAWSGETRNREETMAGDDGAPAGDGEAREEVRDALFDFAKVVAGAEDRAAVIEALADVDEYVDRVVDTL